MISFWKYHKTFLLFIFLSAVFYWAFAFDLDRTDFLKLLGLYSGLFILAYQLFKSSSWNFKTMLVVGLGFRLLFLLAIPNLSQDFYRFIWDGYLNLQGINPYLYTPNELIDTNLVGIPNAQDLFNGMGALSASNYSNYPPVNQMCFTLANLVPGSSILSSVIGLRVLIILADIGILFVGSKLLKSLDLPLSNLFWYVLNPFVIIELTGNLHFEGVMLFFLILSLYLLFKKRLFWSALCFGLSISVKLIPFMLLPLFFSYFTGGLRKGNDGWRSWKNYRSLLLFYCVTLLILVISFIPFLTGEFLENYSKTIGLWFNNFEFNASIYYLLRGLGYVITGYNEIATIGTFLPLITIGFIAYRSIFRDNASLSKLTYSMLLVVSVYLLLSTTVHPWYLTTLLVLGLSTKYKYPIVWTLMVVLSYYAYSQADFKENYWLLAIEYSVVLWIAIKELKGQSFKIRF